MADIDWKTADTTLYVWLKEVDYGYYVLNIKGRLTGEFDFWLYECRYNDGILQAEIELEGTTGKYLTVIAVMPSDRQYAVYYNSEIVIHNERLGGILEISLPCRTKGTLVIK